mmetsp:Transcript_11237/g.15757  ORF Transcript_11237/g.15757 Transcript_11237/m.15757 type:complete len:108 (+) Transcript_11237:240-563(+)
MLPLTLLGTLDAAEELCARSARSFFPSDCFFPVGAFKKEGAPDGISDGELDTEGASDGTSYGEVDAEGTYDGMTVGEVVTKGTSDGTSDGEVDTEGTTVYCTASIVN